MQLIPTFRTNQQFQMKKQNNIFKEQKKNNENNFFEFHILLINQPTSVGIIKANIKLCKLTPFSAKVHKQLFFMALKPSFQSCSICDNTKKKKKTNTQNNLH